MTNKKIVGNKMFLPQIKQDLLEKFGLKEIYVDISALWYLITESEENPSELFNFLFTEKNELGDLVHKNINIVNDDVFVYDVILN